MLRRPERTAHDIPPGETDHISCHGDLGYVAHRATQRFSLQICYRWLRRHKRLSPADCIRFPRQPNCCQLCLKWLHVTGLCGSGSTGGYTGAAVLEFRLQAEHTGVFTRRRNSQRVACLHCATHSCHAKTPLTLRSRSRCFWAHSAWVWLGLNRQ